jgi:hypothetical protein
LALLKEPSVADEVHHQERMDVHAEGTETDREDRIRNPGEDLGTGAQEVGAGVNEHATEKGVR